MTTYAHTTTPISDTSMGDALTAHASLWTSNAPHGLVFALLALVAVAYLACGLITLTARARPPDRRRRSRQLATRRPPTATRQHDRPLTEVTS